MFCCSAEREFELLLLRLLFLVVSSGLTAEAVFHRLLEVSGVSKLLRLHISIVIFVVRIVLLAVVTWNAAHRHALPGTHSTINLLHSCPWVSHSAFQRARVVLEVVLPDLAATGWTPQVKSRSIDVAVPGWSYYTNVQWVKV